MKYSQLVPLHTRHVHRSIHAFATSCIRIVEFIHTMMTSSNRCILRVPGPLCGRVTCDRWMPHTKASDAELCFFSLICAWINVSNCEAGDFRRHRAHYDVTVMHCGVSYKHYLYTATVEMFDTSQVYWYSFMENIPRYDIQFNNGACMYLKQTWYDMHSPPQTNFGELWINIFTFPLKGILNSLRPSWGISYIRILEMLWRNCDNAVEWPLLAYLRSMTWNDTSTHLGVILWRGWPEWRPALHMPWL